MQTSQGRCGFVPAHSDRKVWLDDSLKDLNNKYSKLSTTSGLKVADLDPKDTAVGSFLDFFKFCDHLKKNNPDRFTMVMSNGLIMKLANRTTLWSLMHFVHKPTEFYAIDNAINEVLVLNM